MNILETSELYTFSGCARCHFFTLKRQWRKRRTLTKHLVGEVSTVTVEQGVGEGEELVKKTTGALSAPCQVLRGRRRIPFLELSQQSEHVECLPASPQGHTCLCSLRRYGQLSGMVEPLAGVFGAFAVVLAEPILPYALAFAAGAMVYVVMDDIIPEAQIRLESFPSLTCRCPQPRPSPSLGSALCSFATISFLPPLPAPSPPPPQMCSLIQKERGGMGTWVERQMR